MFVCDFFFFDFDFVFMSHVFSWGVWFMFSCVGKGLLCIFKSHRNFVEHYEGFFFVLYLSK